MIIRKGAKFTLQNLCCGLRPLTPLSFRVLTVAKMSATTNVFRLTCKREPEDKNRTQSASPADVIIFLAKASGRGIKRKGASFCKACPKVKLSPLRKC